jgi:hypothetical protein
MTSTDAGAAAIARATRQIVKGAGAQLAGRKRGPDKRVRRASYDIGDRRVREVWRSINGGTRAGGLRWRDALRKTAREYDLVGKQSGRWAPLGEHARRVLDELLELLDFKTGRLDPSYQRLQARTGFARSTIAGALRKLKTHGFLDWMRRTRVVDVEGGRARQQTSNAYFFSMRALHKRVRQRFADLLGRAERRAAGDTEAPAAPALPRDPELAAAIGRLQAHFDAGAAPPEAE